MLEQASALRARGGYRPGASPCHRSGHAQPPATRPRGPRPGVAAWRPATRGRQHPRLFVPTAIHTQIRRPVPSLDCTRARESPALERRRPHNLATADRGWPG